jgi:dihydropteroate synthase
MGIVNITPDSFSDGGRNLNPQKALETIARMERDGADIIDIGAESTRPGATALTQTEEWKRLADVLPDVANITQFSIDTRHPKTAAKAIKLGADWVNDVSGFSNPDMIEAVRGYDCRLVVMHSLSVPADKNVILPLDADPVELLMDWADMRFAELEKAGIERSQLIFDPGIGFGKNAQQSLTIINGAEKLKELGVPLLFGHSRKSFMGGEAGDEETLRLSQLLADKGVDYLRVHNVKRHRLAIL